MHSNHAHRRRRRRPRSAPPRQPPQAAAGAPRPAAAPRPSGTYALAAGRAARPAPARGRAQGRFAARSSSLSDWADCRPPLQVAPPGLCISRSLTVSGFDWQCPQTSRLLWCSQHKPLCRRREPPPLEWSGCCKSTHAAPRTAAPAPAAAPAQPGAVLQLPWSTATSQQPGEPHVWALRSLPGSVPGRCPLPPPAASRRHDRGSCSAWRLQVVAARDCSAH